MESIWSIKLKSKNKNELLKFVFDQHLDISCGGPTKLDDDYFEIIAYVKDKKKNQLMNLRNDSVKITVIEDMIKKGIERQKDISKENRVKNRRSTVVHGLGIKE